MPLQQHTDGFNTKSDSAVVFVITFIQFHRCLSFKISRQMH